MNPQNDYHDENVPLIFTRHISLLEEINNRTYLQPNSNYLNLVRNTPDIVGTYSDELKALRQIALDAFNVCCNIKAHTETIPRDVVLPKELNRIITFVLKQPWYPTSNHVGKAPVAAEEGDLPSL